MGLSKLKLQAIALILVISLLAGWSKWMYGLGTESAENRLYEEQEKALTLLRGERDEAVTGLREANRAIEKRNRRVSNEVLESVGETLDSSCDAASDIARLLDNIAEQANSGANNGVD